MTDEDFEKLLQRQKPRAIPAEWRSAILSRAATALPKKEEPGIAWWRQLLWPSPVAWGCVACAWGLIVVLNFASRPSASFAAGLTVPTSQDLSAMIASRHELLRELSFTNSAPSEAPRRHETPGAYVRPKSENEIV